MPSIDLIKELGLWFGLLLSAAFGNPIPEEIIIVSGGIRAAHLERYVVTDRTIESLRAAGLREPVLRKLETLKGKPPQTEKQFLAELEQTIDKEMVVLHQELLLKAAAQPDPWRWLMLPACMLGPLIADVLLYGIGRLFGEVIFRSRILSKLAPPEKQERIRENLHRYGVIIFVIGRAVPGIRTTLFLTAGSARLALWKFCIADGIGGALGTSLFFFLGYALGDQFKELIAQVEKQIMPSWTILLILLLSAVGAYLIYRFLRQPIPTGDPAEVPLIGQQIASHLPTAPAASPASPPPSGQASPAEPVRKEPS